MKIIFTYDVLMNTIDRMESLPLVPNTLSPIILSMDAYKTYHWILLVQSSVVRWVWRVRTV